MPFHATYTNVSGHDASACPALRPAASPWHTQCQPAPPPPPAPPLAPRPAGGVALPMPGTPRGSMRRPTGMPCMHTWGKGGGRVSEAMLACRAALAVEYNRTRLPADGCRRDHGVAAGRGHSRPPPRHCGGGAGKAGALTMHIRSLQGRRRRCHCVSHVNRSAAWTAHRSKWSSSSSTSWPSSHRRNCSRSAAGQPGRESARAIDCLCRWYPAGPPTEVLGHRSVVKCWIGVVFTPRTPLGP